MFDIRKLENVRVLVVGDVMLDRYWWGSVSRISPEAPVPVVRLSKTTYAAGGAANVAANVAGLGATPVLVGITGGDDEAALFPSILAGVNVDPSNLIRLPGRPTTVKSRVLAHNQQVVRVDQEDDTELDSAEENAVIERLSSLLSNVGSVVLSDYAKGFLTRNILDFLIADCRKRKISVLVDPKGKDYSKYAGVSLITPNRAEAIEAAHVPGTDKAAVALAGERLLATIDAEAFLVTQGEDGMTLFRRDTPPHHLYTAAQQVYDVTGAGDTVIATLGAAIAAECPLTDAAFIANMAAGVVVGHVGTTAIKTSELTAALSESAASGN
ncbi:MAG: D-glycero-beta-D-manno-heptose-7-phosphate kinase [Pyrinomonadaceae bacterium]